MISSIAMLHLDREGQPAPRPAQLYDHCTGENQHPIHGIPSRLRDPPWEDLRTFRSTSSLRGMPITVVRHVLRDSIHPPLLPDEELGGLPGSSATSRDEDYIRPSLKHLESIRPWPDTYCRVCPEGPQHGQNDDEPSMTDSACITR